MWVGAGGTGLCLCAVSSAYTAVGRQPHTSPLFFGTTVAGTQVKQGRVHERKLLFYMAVCGIGKDCNKVESK